MKVPTNHFKAAINAGKPQVGIWNSLCSNIVSDVLSTVGFDWALIDMEHSPNSVDIVLGQMQGYLGSKTHPVVRPPWREPVIIKRLLDTGAQSLLLPMVQSAEDAEDVVRFCTYPPRGIRGVSLSHRGNRYGAAGMDYLENFEKELCILVQVETKEALGRVDEIAAVDGVDGVFFGPADLSMDMGFPGQMGHPEVQAAISEGGAKAHKQGKAAGILMPDIPSGKHWLGEGFEFVACGSDQGLLATAARKVYAELASADDTKDGGKALSY